MLGQAPFELYFPVFTVSSIGLSAKFPDIYLPNHVQKHIGQLIPNISRI